MKTDNLIRGLLILQPLADNDWFVGASHDVINTIVEVDKTAEDISKKLKELGWHVEDGCWSAFV